MMACASHSPLFYAPGRVNSGVLAVQNAIKTQRERIQAFDPELVILFGGDHYGGHQMAAMPAFCIGIEATALADIGGFPGPLRVPRDIAVGAVNYLRQEDVDVAVSYAMTVDHGFSLPLENLTGAIDAYPVLPIFVCCLQPPFVPFRRARMLGEAVGRYARTLSVERVLILGTGGLSHDPEFLFPAIDDVSEEWRPYILHGNAQTAVSQQSWIDYEIAAHADAVPILIDDTIPIETFKILKTWDEAFFAAYCEGDPLNFDTWVPGDVAKAAGIGAMEILSWIAAAAAMRAATGRKPRKVFQQPCREMGIGFGIAEIGPASGLPLVG